MLRLSCVVGVLLALGSVVAADEIRLFSGETFTGRVTRTTPSRLVFRPASGPILSLHKRRIETAFDGEGKPFALRIELTHEPLTPAAQAMLRQAHSTDHVYANPALMKFLDGCSVATVEELTRLARDPNSKTRGAAIAMLARVGAPEAVRELVRIATGDDDRKIRFAAATRLMDRHVVRCIGTEGLLAAVKRGLSDKSGNNRFCFAYVVGTLGDPSAVPVLKLQLKNTDHHFRESAALLLAEMGDPSGIPMLLRMLRATGPETEKIAICKALGKLKADAARYTLKRLAKSKSAKLAEAAAEAIAAIEA